MKTEDGNEGLHPWIEPELEARLTALVLGEASDFEREELERLIAERSELGFYRKRLEAMHRMLREVATGESAEKQGEWRLGAERREGLLAKLGADAERLGNVSTLASPRRPRRWGMVLKVAACVVLAGLLLSVMVPGKNSILETAKVSSMREQSEGGYENADSLNTLRDRYQPAQHEWRYYPGQRSAEDQAESERPQLAYVEEASEAPITATAAPAPKVALSKDTGQIEGLNGFVKPMASGDVDLIVSIDQDSSKLTIAEPSGGTAGRNVGFVGSSEGRTTAERKLGRGTEDFGLDGANTYTGGASFTSGGVVATTTPAPVSRSLDERSLLESEVTGDRQEGESVRSRIARIEQRLDGKDSELAESESAQVEVGGENRVDLFESIASNGAGSVSNRSVTYRDPIADASGLTTSAGTPADPGTDVRTPLADREVKLKTSALSPKGDAAAELNPGTGFDDQGAEDKVPYFGDLPVVGRLFRSADGLFPAEEKSAAEAKKEARLSDLAAGVPAPAASPVTVTAMPSKSRKEVDLELQSSGGVIAGQSGSGLSAATDSPMTGISPVPLGAPKPAEPSVATNATSSFSLSAGSVPLATDSSKVEMSKSGAGTLDINGGVVEFDGYATMSGVDLDIEGNDRTKDDVTRRELPVSPGQAASGGATGTMQFGAGTSWIEDQSGFVEITPSRGVDSFGREGLSRKAEGFASATEQHAKSVQDILALSQQVGADDFKSDTKTKAHVIRRELPLDDEHPYDKTKSNETRSRWHAFETANSAIDLDYGFSLGQTEQNSVERFQFSEGTIFESELPKAVSIDSAGKDSRLLRQPTPAALDETSPSTEPFSTFSLHVSDVSFQLAKAALAAGQWPEAEKIRIEEFVNAFDYGDPVPSMGERVSCRIDQGAHPFLQQRNLVRIALRTAEAGRSAGTPLRLTLLLDSSGSMERPDRRETLTRAVATLAGLLGENDQVTLVTFARQPRLVVDAVAGNEAMKLAETVAALPSEGGTNLEAALQLAFEKAREHQDPNAQNRIVLLTDGAANLGDAKAESLGQRVEMMRDAGIAFDAAGFGADGLNDEILEALTRKGDGRYYLLDRPEDAEDAFAKQIAGALRPAAKNVKVQVEFNPDRVKSYKLLGFEKHRLETEDFRNDAVDAAEMAAAEAGVAVYQVEPDPAGEGDLGSVSVRFRDLDSGEMIERRWALPHVVAPAADQGGEAIRLATVASQFAAKLAGGPLGDVVDLAELARLAAALPDSERVKELRTMIEQARDLKGNR